jgi:hypothetical protein
MTMEFPFWQLRVPVSHSRKNFNRYGKFRYMEGAVRVRNIQVHSTVSCPHENVHIAPWLTEEEEDGCLLSCTSDSIKGSYADVLMYHLIATQFTRHNKQKAGGNKIKIQM